MYTCRTIPVPHSIWTGKPEEEIESILNHLGRHSWRLPAINKESKGGKFHSLLLLEKVVDAEYYKDHPLKSLPPEYNPDDLV